MSTRRPLSSNINAVNSPLRPSAAFNPKLKTRSHADMMRDEPYGQPPPAKRQQVDHGVRRAVASPTRSRAARTIVHRGGTKTAAGATSKAASTSTYQPTAKELEEIRLWQTSIRARFPKQVFYFESVPEDQRAKLTKLVTSLGGVCLPPLDILPSPSCTYARVIARGKVLLHRHHSRGDDATDPLREVGTGRRRPACRCRAAQDDRPVPPEPNFGSWHDPEETPVRHVESQGPPAAGPRRCHQATQDAECRCPGPRS